MSVSSRGIAVLRWGRLGILLHKNLDRNQRPGYICADDSGRRKRVFYVNRVSVFTKKLSRKLVSYQSGLVMTTVDV